MEPQAEFIGYQEDERIGGVRPFFVIVAPGYARHLSTVFANTLKELGIPIPNYPSYAPKNTKKEKIWIYKCEDCHISYVDSTPLVAHAKTLKHVNLTMDEITVSETIPTGKVEEDKVVKTAVIMLKESKQEDTQEIPMVDLINSDKPNEKESWNRIKASLAQKYPFLNETQEKKDD